VKIENGFFERTPDNISELVKKAADRTSWKRRLEAVKELRKWKCQQSKDVLTRLAFYDLVSRVKEEAFISCTRFRSYNQRPAHSSSKST